MMQISPPILITVVMFIAGLVLLLFSLRWFTSGEEDFSNRLTEFVSEQQSHSKNWTPILASHSRNISGSITKRLLIPWLRGMGRLFGRMTPTKNLQSITRQLSIAGNPMGMQGREFYGISMMLLFFGIFVAILMLRRGLDRNNLMIAVVIVLIGYMLPRTWLSSRVKARSDQIRKGLPDALDMLSVCASAGLGFDQALQRVSEHWNTPIAVELGRVITEMEMGISRRDALRNLSDRLDVAELTSFVSFIIQTDQLGMSITDTLHAQADQLRVERRHRAQEQAQKIPTKMLIPMAFLIFPALMAIILGPAVPNIVMAVSVMNR